MTQGGAIETAVPLPTRMRPGAPFHAAADWAAFVQKLRPLLAATPDEGRDAADRLAARLDDTDPGRIDAAAAREWVDLLLAACPGMDQREYGRDTNIEREACRPCFRDFARWLVAGSGTAVISANLDRLRPRRVSNWFDFPESVWDVPTALGLRAALVGATDADYDRLVDDCCRLYAAETDAKLAMYLAFILADDRPDAQHPLRSEQVLLDHADDLKTQRSAYRRQIPLLVDVRPSIAAPWRANAKFEPSRCDVKAEEAAATLIDVAQSSGEPAAPSILWLLDETTGAETTRVAAALLATREAGALEALLPHVGSKLVRDAIDAAERADPAWVLRQCLAAGRGQTALATRIAGIVDRHGADQVRAWTRDDPEASRQIERALAAREVPLAPRKAWPSVLRDPPWRRKRKPRDPVALDLEPIPTLFAHGFGAYDTLGRDSYEFRRATVLRHMCELAVFIQKAETVVHYDNAIPPHDEPVPAAGDPPDRVLAWLQRRLAATRESAGFQLFNYGPLICGVAWQPEPLARMLWEAGPVLSTSTFTPAVISVAIARFGEAAMQQALPLLTFDDFEMPTVIAKIDDADIAPIAARALKAKKTRKSALDWLARHPRTAAMRLLPAALGPSGPERMAAEQALRALIADNPEARPILDAAIDEYAAIDPRVREAVAAGLDGDPLDRVPARTAKAPAWAVPSALSRPRLRAGGALPDEAIAALIEMLAFSSPLDPYAGLAVVREACTAESLGTFAIDLFRAWVAFGAHHAGEWAMLALAWLGDDACARDLTRQIRVWASAKQRGKAFAGIDVLNVIGSDVALMNLNALAEKSPFPKIRDHAGIKLRALADARGLSMDELFDRLSPDLDLDARGGLDLSFGPRAFRVGFDETLRPWIKDASGQRLKALPKPAKSDDADLARAATKRWAGLKKDAEATAGLQVTRLETMLTTTRRVPPDVFWMFFAAHPFVRHLTGRLVWGLFENAASTQPRLSFRVTDDLAITDAADDPVTLDVSADAPGVVGPIHPLHLSPDELARWATLFGDYEIGQPFPQIGRETYAFTAREAESSRIDRFDGARVVGGRLRGLRPRGWEANHDGDMIRSVSRALGGPDGPAQVILAFEDGLDHRPHGGDAIQTLRGLSLHGATSRACRFGDLDAVTASEVLRVPSLLAAMGV